MKRALAGCLLSAAMLIPRAANSETVNYAIVIGNNDAPVLDSQVRLTKLRYADDDAARYFQVFSQLGETRLLTELDLRTQKRFPGLASKTSSPTLANLRQVVRQFEVSMRADRERGDSPVLYFAFSGHGARGEDGTPYLALVDGKLDQAVLYEELLAALPTHYSHLIVDACHAGGVVGVRGGFFDNEVSGDTAPVSRAELVPVLKADRMKQHPRLGVLISASLGEEAHEWSEIESGVFTHEVLSGLLGAADINSDQTIEYSEIRAFVASARRDIKDLRARPQIVARAPQANRAVPLLDTAKLQGSRVLSGDASKLGRFFIELPNGARYLEAHLSSETASLRIPKGRAFVRTALYEANVPAGESARFSELSWKPRSTASRGSLDDSYRRMLFHGSYGRAYYEGWVDNSGGYSVRFQPPGATAPPPPSDGDRSTGKRNLALGFATVAGVAGITAAVGGYRALDARSDWHATEKQVEADRAKERYESNRKFAAGALLVSALSGATAWYLWPGKSVTVDRTRTGGFAIGVRSSW